MNNSGILPDDIRKHCITKKGLRFTIRSVQLSDEKAMGNFFHSLSNASIHKRFLSRGKYLPHKRLKDFTVVNYNKNIFLIATTKKYFRELILGLGQCWLNEETLTADVAFIVTDKYHRQGICEELLKYLISLAQERIILGFSAEVLVDNIPMQNLFKKYGFKIIKRIYDIYELKLVFKDIDG